MDRDQLPHFGALPGKSSGLNWAAWLTWFAVASWPALEVAAGRMPLTPGVVVGFVSMASLLLLAILRMRFERQSPPSLRAAAVCVLLQLPAALISVALLPQVTQVILLVVIAGQLGAYFQGRQVLTLLALANFVVGALLLGRMPFAQALVVSASFIGFQAFAAMAAGYARKAEAARDAALAAHAELVAAQSLLADSARGEERLRLARELHDVAGHKLTALKLQLELALRRSPEGMSAPLQTLHRLADELLGDVRGVVTAMRRHEGVDLPGALEALAKAFPPGLVELEMDAGLRIGAIQQAEALLRCAQEGVTNAVRHGRANRIRVTLRAGQDGLRLTVEDNGRGMQPGSAGHGLQGLQERVEALAGRLEVEANRSGGTRLSAWLPA